MRRRNMNDFARERMRDRDRRGERGMRGGRGYDERQGRYEFEGYGEYDGSRYDMRYGDKTYDRPEYDRGGKYPEYSDEYDYGYDRRMRGREDYGRYDEYRDYARRRRDSRGRFMRDRGEYDTDYFTKHDIESWKRGMINEDGSRGEHFNKEQVMQYAKQVGVDIQQFGDATFCLAMNMMYSDYCGVAKKFGFDRPEVYADLAKAFLDDKDFDGEPEEKLYLYYKCIVEKE